MLLEVHGWIPRLVERQFENLQDLCAHRITARRHHDWTARTLRRLEERIDAYVDALVLAGGMADELFAAELGGGRRFADLAAGLALLRSGEPRRARLLWDALSSAAPEHRVGMAQALWEGPIDPLRAELSDPGEDLAAVAALALRLRDEPGPSPTAVQRWRADPDPLVRAAGWRLAGLDPHPFPPASDFVDAVDDPEPDVREAAYWAAFVSGRGFLREHCVARFARDVVAMRWFVVMTAPDDAELWRAALADDATGPERFIAAGGSGLLELGEPLLDAMAGSPEDAVAANIGYRRLTGADFQSQERRRIPAEDPEFDLERHVYVPDAETARSHYEALRAGRTEARPADDTRSGWEHRCRTTADPPPLVG